MGAVRSRASISTVLVRPLASLLEPSPQALAAFFAATDLTKEMLADVDARVSPAQFCDPMLALQIADATPAGAFGIVEYVCRSSPTLRDALAQWIRYLGILDDAVEVALVDLDEEQGQVSLRVVTESEAPAPASHELCFALVARHARTMLAGWFHVTEVRFTHRVSEANAARYREHFDAPVRFGAEYTELVLPASVLATALSTADPNLLAILLPAAEEKRSRKPADPPVTDQVRRALRTALSNDDAQIDTVAKRLGMTGRSLQRRLKDEDTSFQNLRDEVRRDLADRYLGLGMSFAEISFLLGFSEPSAFFRAFKRWTGLTPMERRASLSRARPA